jgi:predicted flap endonuclease-1-like 5' DNA nuclease
MGISGNKMTNIVKIEGIGPVYRDKLVAAGIKTTEKLLEAGCMAKAREELAAKTGIPHKLILEWVNLADLMRINGVGEEYSDLLEEAGVDTVAELANRKPENLLQKIMETNEKEKLVRRPPVLKQVQKWVEEAKKLPRKVEY